MKKGVIGNVFQFPNRALFHMQRATRAKVRST